MTYSTPDWKRELTMGVASQLLGKPRQVESLAVQSAAMIVHQADLQFGFAQAVAQLPADQVDKTDLPVDEEGNVGTNPYVEALVRFWNAVGKKLRPGGVEDTRAVRAGLKEYSRHAWLTLDRAELVKSRRLARETLEQVAVEGHELEPGKWTWPVESGGW